MNKKISIGLAIALIIISVTATFAITMTVAQKIYNNLISDLPERKRMYSSVAEIDEIVRAKYLGDIDDSYHNSQIVNGYIEGINDKQSYYMTADEYNDYLATIQGKKSGIGISSLFDTQTNAMHITNVFTGSPAEAAGLKKGDLIIEVEGETVNATNYSEIETRLSGRKLSSVKIVYKRENIEHTINVSISDTNQSVSGELIGSIGYIKFTGFYQNSAAQLKAVLEKLTTDGAKKLVLDVRNVSSGTLEYAVQALDLLVPTATGGSKRVVTLIDKAGNKTTPYTTDAADISLDMRVLVNSNTGGCAELFACNLRDFEKARLIGEQTMGNGTNQEVFALSDGSAVILTTASVVPYISPSYDGIGLTPNSSVSLTDAQKESLDLLSHEEDAQLQKAISELSV